MSIVAEKRCALLNLRYKSNILLPTFHCEIELNKTVASLKFQSIVKLKIKWKSDKILPHLFKENSGSQFKLKGRPSLEASAGKSSLLAELSGPGLRALL